MAEGGVGRRDFFISRAGEDKAVALRIDQILREAGYSTFIQDKDFGPASFMARMAEGWSSGARLVCVLSRAYQSSEFCKKEYEVALKDDPRNKRNRVIVLRIDDCVPVEHLADLAYTDLSTLLNDATAVRAAVLHAVDPAHHAKPQALDALSNRANGQIRHPEFAPVKDFVPRTDELAGLETALWRGSGRAALTNATSATVAATGMGGVGKSVLARQYGWDNRERYAGLWWIRAETRETLLDDLVALGCRFNDAIGAMPDREAAARIVLDHIAEAHAEKPWLLVYDNVEDPEKIRRLAPPVGAHVLITTRWQNWFGEAQAVPVGVYPREVAIDYLMAQARGAAERPDETRRQATALAHELGNLPLALAIARAHAWGMNWSFAEYSKHLAEMIAREPTRSIDYPRSVAATIGLAIDKAKQSSPEAEKLLGIAAFLAPDRIPLDIVTDDVMSAIEKGEAVAGLAEVSLVTPEPLDDGSPGISVHRLTQAVMRARLGVSPSPLREERRGEGRGEGQPQAPTAAQEPAPHPIPLPAEERGEGIDYAALATRLVADAYPRGEIGPDDVRSWPACRRLEGHAVAVLEHAPDTGEAAQKTARLLNQYALHLTSRAEYTGTEALYRRALAIDEANYGPDHPIVAIRLNNLAQLLQATNRLDEAEPLMHRALAIDEATYGPDHPDVAIDLNNLAQLLRVTNRLAEAEPLYRRALAIDEASLGPDHPNVAIRLNNLAQLLKATNRLGEAEPLMRGALAIDEASFGPDHPFVARDINNLAQLLQDTDRLDEAEPLMRRALAIDEASLGPDHPDVARDLNNLARLLQDTNRLDDAEPLMRRAVDIWQRSLGPDHPSTKLGLDNLAVLEADIAAAKRAPSAPSARPANGAAPPAPPAKRSWRDWLRGR